MPRIAHNRIREAPQNGREKSVRRIFDKWRVVLNYDRDKSIPRIDHNRIQQAKKYGREKSMPRIAVS